MKTYLVIATGAKTGGALTIINLFLEWAATKDKYKFILIAPKVFLKKKNITHIKISTSGITTIFFSLIVSIFYIIKYKPSIVISFSNLPIFFSKFFKPKVYTYFHNLNLVFKKNLKSKIYQFLIKYFSEEVIVQTQYSKKIVKSFFNKKIHIIWPGVMNHLKKKKKLFFKKTVFAQSTYLFYPVTNIYNKNKNFKFLIERSSFFKKNDIKIILPATSKLSSRQKNNDFLKFIGPLKIEKMYQVYKMCSATIFLSLNESLGLPIYESLSLGKPTFVFERPYIKENLRQFKKDRLLILFKEKEFEKKIIKYLNSRNIEKIKNKPSKIYINNNWNDIL